MVERQIDELQSMKQSDPEAIVSELESNLAKIKRNKTMYYNEKQDKKWIKRYYEPITNHGDPIRLYRDLQKLVIKTHTDKKPYFISKDQYLYTWVDLQPNGRLTCIYSGKQRDPQEFIEEDFEVLEERFHRYKKLLHTDKYTNKEMSRKIRNISRQHRFNAEHVVPQSWYRGKEPMKGDLHHLFACEPICNRMRSNYPYDHFENLDAQNSCGTHIKNRFEPSYGKGVVARASLYFFLRYPKKITRKFQKQLDIPLLINWHKQYEVTDYEKHRNKAIYEIQGNRNPFIDFPEIVDEITIPDPRYKY